MATIKSYSDLQQSKKLAKILPLESADMYWYLATKGNPKAMFNEGHNKYGDFELPCWSFAALLNILPNANILLKGFDKIYDLTNSGGEIARANNPVDACVTMIERLHERKML